MGAVVCAVLAIASGFLAWHFHSQRKSREALLQQVSEEMRLTQAENDRLKNSMASIQQNLSEKEKELLKKQTEAETLNQNLSQTQTQIRQISEEKERLARDREKLAKDKEQLASALDKLRGDLKGQMANQDISITESGGAVTIKITDKVLFDSGRAEIKTNGQAILDKIALALQKFPDRVVRVEGHTDNVPVSDRIKDRFPSNWELSTARAAAAVRYLQEKCQIPPQRMQVLGLGESRPIAANDSEENRSKNRRIELVLLPAGSVPGLTPPATATPISE